MDALKKLLACLLCLNLCACTKPSTAATRKSSPAIAEDIVTDQKNEVALYLEMYQHLPACYMTKKEARKKGWSGGALHETVEGRCIGGDVYGNYEEVLPQISGKYYECDINTLTKTSRGAERIIYDDDTDDIDVYYTNDHYETFTLLYGDGNYE
jgi:hypothetical protein